MRIVHAARVWCRTHASGVAMALSLLIHAGMLALVAFLPIGRGPGERGARELHAYESARMVTVRLVLMPRPTRQKQAVPRSGAPEDLPPSTERLADAGRPPPLEALSLPPIPETLSIHPATPDAARLKPLTTLDVARASPPESPFEPIESNEPEGPQEPENPSEGTTDLAKGCPGEPTGVRILYLPIPRYPPRSQRLGEEGLVLLEVEVLPTGQAGTIRVLEDPGYGRLVAAAKEAVRKAQFEPATRDGRPIRSTIQIPFRFVLE